MHKTLSLLFNTFTKVYLIFSILTFLYIALGIAIPILVLGFVPTHVAQLLGGLLFNLSTFIIWYIIFKTILGFFNNNTKINYSSQGLRKIGFCFLFSFCIDLGRFVYSNGVLKEPSIDWSKINFPNWQDPLPLFLHGLIQIFFKGTFYFSGFLTPTVSGLASIFLGLICFQLSKQVHE